MFGLEGDKKKNDTEFVFDLEEELKDPTKGREIRSLTEKRTQEVKTILRSGEDKKSFDEFGKLLLGYASLLKVVARVQAVK